MNAVLSSGLEGQEVTWTSSNPSIATVDNNGLVHARYSSGEVTITAQVGSVKATRKITVEFDPHVVSPTIPNPTINSEIY